MPFYKNKNLQLYLFFFAITTAFYGITYKAGFTTDFMGWFHNYDNYSFSEVINSEPNHIKSFYQFTHLLMYAMTFLFRLSGLPWFILFVGLFSLNVYFIFTIFRKLFNDLKLENGFAVAMFGVLFFMLSPYQAEVMIWRASFHYLTGFAMMLGIVTLALKYSENPKLLYVYWAIGIFICSSFSLEYFLFTPFVVLIFLIFKAWTNDFRLSIWFNNFKNPKSKIQNPKSINYFVGIPLLIDALYFIVHRAITGKFFAHGRDMTNLSILSLNSFSTYAKYFVKELFFLRHLKHETKEKIFSFLDTPYVAWIIIFVGIGIVVLGLINFSKISARAKLLLLNFSLFSVLLVPVMSIFFSWILLSENDRYCYMPSAFLFMGLSIALSRLPKILFYTIAGAYLLFSSYLLIKTNRIWWKSEKIVSNMSKTFHSWEATEIYVLNAPDNYNGVPMFRVTNDTSGVVEAAEVYQKRKFNGKAIDVLQYNMTTPSDGVEVKVISPDTLVVTLNQWGNWWWKFGIGGGDYETTDYKVKTDFSNCNKCYTLIMKNRKPGRVFLYQTGNELKEVIIKNEK